MNPPFKSMRYVPHPICRFPQLFTANPEHAIDLERYHAALASAVRLESASTEGIENCRRSHTLLQIIQKEILKDAATVAYSQAVQALEKEHKEVLVVNLCGVRDAQIAEVEHFRTEVLALRRACENAVSQRFNEESQQRHVLLEQFNSSQRSQRENHALAIAVVEEIGRLANQDCGANPELFAAKVKEAETAYHNELNRIRAERDAAVSALNKSCENVAKPLWAMYTDGYQKAQSWFQEAYDQSNQTLAAKTKAVRESLESQLQAAQDQIDPLYQPAYEAAECLNLAAQAFLAQMKVARKNSAAVLSTRISEMFETSR